MEQEYQGNGAIAVWLAGSDKRFVSCEIIRDFDGTYCANLAINGDPVQGLPGNVAYRDLKAAVLKEAGVQLPDVGSLRFTKMGRKQYAMAIAGLLLAGNANALNEMENKEDLL